MGKKIKTVISVLIVMSALLTGCANGAQSDTYKADEQAATITTKTNETLDKIIEIPADYYSTATERGMLEELYFFGATLKRVPLMRDGVQIKRNYCAFWKKDNSGYYVEEFAEILKSMYE